MPSCLRKPLKGRLNTLEMASGSFFLPRRRGGIVNQVFNSEVIPLDEDTIQTGNPHGLAPTLIPIFAKTLCQSR